MVYRYEPLPQMPFVTVPMTRNSTQLKNSYQISWLWSTENHLARAGCWIVLRRMILASRLPSSVASLKRVGTMYCCRSKPLSNSAGSSSTDRSIPLLKDSPKVATSPVSGRIAQGALSSAFIVGNYLINKTGHGFNGIKWY